MVLNFIKLLKTDTCMVNSSKMICFTLCICCEQNAYWKYVAKGN